MVRETEHSPEGVSANPVQPYGDALIILAAMMGDTNDAVIRSQRAMGTEATARDRVLRLTEDRRQGRQGLMVWQSLVILKARAVIQDPKTKVTLRSVAHSRCGRHDRCSIRSARRSENCLATHWPKIEPSVHDWHWAALSPRTIADTSEASIARA